MLRNKVEKLLKFRGGLAAVLTPFDQNGEVNLQMINPYVKYLTTNKVDGVYVIGTTGEGYSLTNDERIKIMKKWREEIKQQKSDMMMVVNITSTCTKEMIELAKECEKYEVDAIAVLPPAYYKLQTIKGMVDYLKLIGNAAPNTPLLYYHIPLFNGELPFELIDLVREALKDVPQFCAMKFTDYNIARLLMLQNNFKDKLKIFAGFDEVLSAALFTGQCNAAVCALFSFPNCIKSYHMILDAHDNKDMETARKEQTKIIDEVLKHKSNGNFFLSVKTHFNKMVESSGMNMGMPRPPIYFH